LLPTSLLDLARYMPEIPHDPRTHLLPASLLDLARSIAHVFVLPTYHPLFCCTPSCRLRLLYPHSHPCTPPASFPTGVLQLFWVHKAELEILRNCSCRKKVLYLLKDNTLRLRLYKLLCTVSYSMPTFLYRYLFIKCCLADCLLKHYIGHS